MRVLVERLFARRPKLIEHRFSIDEKAFRCLIRGGQLTFSKDNNRTQVHLLLQDIGYGNMLSIVNAAKLEQPDDWIKESVAVDEDKPKTMADCFSHPFENWGRGV